MSYGDILANARNKDSITIEQIAHELKININVLRKLEASDSENLPRPTYTRGFIRSYAGMLNLNPEPILELYNESIADQKSPDVKKSVLKGEFDPTPFFLSDYLQRKILPISVLIVLVTLGVFSLTKLNQFENKKPMPKVTKAVKVETSFKLNEVSEDVSQDEVAAAGEVKALVKAAKPKEIAPKEVEKPVKDLEAAAEDVSTKIVKEAEPSPKAVTYAHTLVVEPLAKSQLYIKTNLDEKFVRARLRLDKTREFKFDSAKIRFVDAGAVNLIFDGKDLGTPGGFAEDKTIDFPSLQGL